MSIKRTVLGSGLGAVEAGKLVAEWSCRGYEPRIQTHLEYGGASDSRRHYVVWLPGEPFKNKADTAQEVSS